VVEVIEHRFFQGVDGGMASPPDATLCDFREEPLDQIEPTSARGSEVDVIARVA
jgi:hypothetical protein